MRVLLVALAGLALTGCMEEPSQLIGEWKSKHTGAELIITDSECRYYYGKGAAVGIKCELDHLTPQSARITLPQGDAFVEGKITKLPDTLTLKVKGGGMDFLDPV